MTQDVLRAAGLWAAGCRACRVEQLASIRFGGATYLRGGLLKWYDATFDGVVRPNRKAEEDLLDALGPEVELTAAGDPARTAKRLTAYQLVASPSQRMVKLCALQLDSSTPVLSTIQTVVCAPEGLADTDIVRINLMFRDNGETYCGSTADIIGCRASLTLTEYNTRDYRFVLGDIDQHTVGSGPTEVPFLLVLIHEMGHWIGLPHINEGSSIMASTLASARCIDDVTVARLSTNQDAGKLVGASAFRLGLHRKRAPDAGHGRKLNLLRRSRRTSRSPVV